MASKRIELIIPTGPFTTKDLFAQNPHVSAFVVQSRLKEWMKAGQVLRIGRSMAPGNRKAHYVYQRSPPLE